MSLACANWLQANTTKSCTTSQGQPFFRTTRDQTFCLASNPCYLLLSLTLVTYSHTRAEAVVSPPHQQCPPLRVLRSRGSYKPARMRVPRAASSSSALIALVLACLLTPASQALPWKADSASLLREAARLAEAIKQRIASPDDSDWHQALPSGAQGEGGPCPSAKSSRRLEGQSQAGSDISRGSEGQCQKNPLQSGTGGRRKLTGGFCTPCFTKKSKKSKSNRDRGQGDDASESDTTRTGHGESERGSSATAGESTGQSETRVVAETRARRRLLWYHPPPPPANGGCCSQARLANQAIISLIKKNYTITAVLLYRSKSLLRLWKPGTFLAASNKAYLSAEARALFNTKVKTGSKVINATERVMRYMTLRTYKTYQEFRAAAPLTYRTMIGHRFMYSDIYNYTVKRGNAMVKRRYFGFESASNKSRSLINHPGMFQNGLVIIQGVTGLLIPPATFVSPAPPPRKRSPPPPKGTPSPPPPPGTVPTPSPFIPVPPSVVPSTPSLGPSASPPGGGPSTISPSIIPGGVPAPLPPSPSPPAGGPSTLPPSIIPSAPSVQIPVNNVPFLPSPKSGPSSPTAGGPSGPSASGPSGPTASGPSGPTASGPSGPTASGPSGPSASGPSGPTASGPSAGGPSGPPGSAPTSSTPSASGPAGPSTSGPTASGPTSSGPTASGPTSSGPTASGPTSSGPSSSGPTASGPTGSGPTASGPSASPSAVPTAATAAANAGLQDKVLE